MTERAQILVVEDDRQISQFLLASLSAAGSPSLAATVAGAQQAFGDKKPALVILDLGLPKVDGLNVLSAIIIGIVITIWRILLMHVLKNKEI